MIKMSFSTIDAASLSLIAPLLGNDKTLLEEFTEKLSHFERQTFVLKNDGEILGTFSLDRVSTVPESCVPGKRLFLSHFAACEGDMRGDLTDILVGYAQDRCIAMGHMEVTAVFPKNDPLARASLKKHGFSQVLTQLGEDELRLSDLTKGSGCCGGEND